VDRKHKQREREGVKMDEVTLINVDGLVVKARPEGISVITDYERLVPWKVIIMAHAEVAE
jgi:hypothetical protein